MCGIIGIISQKPVADQLYDGLITMQHRGQDSAGIVTCDDYQLYRNQGQGLVRDVFSQDIIEGLLGHMGIGHVRYPTSGEYQPNEVQPFCIRTPLKIAIAHNGNIINYQTVKAQLEANGACFNTYSDTEVVLQFISQAIDSTYNALDTAQFFDRFCEVFTQLMHTIKGAYSLVISVAGFGTFALRDPHGIRPLVMGVRSSGEHKSYMFASENTPFYSLGFECEDDVKAGEVVFASCDGQLMRRQLVEDTFRPCMFEYVYFARPDAMLDDISVYRARLRLGQNLAKRWVEAHPDLVPDVVIPVPSSSNTAGLAFAHELGVRYTEGLYKNPFVGRTFIMPTGEKRRKSVSRKLSPQATEIEGKRVLLLDDSIVRGTTSKTIVKMVRDYGAKEVYFVSTCPPVKHPCYYGIDIPTEEELVANAKQTVDEIKTYLDVDALLYQTIEDMEEALTRRGSHQVSSLCKACLDGDYFCGISDHAKLRSSDKVELKRT